MNCGMRHEDGTKFCWNCGFDMVNFRMSEHDGQAVRNSRAGSGAYASDSQILASYGISHVDHDYGPSELAKHPENASKDKRSRASKIATNLFFALFMFFIIILGVALFLA